MNEHGLGFEIELRSAFLNRSRCLIRLEHRVGSKHKVVQTKKLHHTFDDHHTNNYGILQQGYSKNEIVQDQVQH